MSIRIALVGNPNSGKSTMFNVSTGPDQYVGNWSGVTVEKKEGTLKSNEDIKITDLPRVYSFSPYTSEEVVSRNYLINEKSGVIIDVVDASNTERNLYLTAQLSKIGTSMVLVLNMMDAVKKNNDKLNTKLISEKLGVPIVEVSTLKKLNSDGLIEVVQKQAKSHHESIRSFSDKTENVLTEIENSIESIKDPELKRRFAVRTLERDEKVLQVVHITDEEKAKVEGAAPKTEGEYDGDGESIITGERYTLITSIISGPVQKGR